MSSLFLLVFLLVAGAAPVAAGAGAAYVAPCDDQFIPVDLDFPRAVQTGPEVHLHGFYRIGHDTPVYKGAAAMERNMTLLFNNNDYDFRVAVAPSDAHVMDLMLHEVVSPAATKGAPPTTKMTACSTGTQTQRFERMIAATLKKGTTYILVFRYSLTLGNDVATTCPKVLLELAAQPVSSAPAFRDMCASDTTFPVLTDNGGPIIPTEEQRYYFSYRSEGPSWAALTPPALPDIAVSDDDANTVAASGASATPAPTRHPRLAPIAPGYDIFVPHIPGRHQKWKLRVQLHANFLDGGDLALLLTTGNRSQAPSMAECAQGHLDCQYGLRAVKNTFIMQQVLWSSGGSIVRQERAADNGLFVAPAGGNYTLWIVLRNTVDNLGLTCAPYQLTIDLFPMPEEETFVTCAADPLPISLHGAGLYNSDTGVLRLTQDVLLNLTDRFQVALLRPTVPKSLGRFSLTNHLTLDVDLALFDVQRVNPDGTTSSDIDLSSLRTEDIAADKSLRFTLVAQSINERGPDGFVVELTGGKTYAVELAVVSPFRRIADDGDRDFVPFCDTVELQAHVFPVPTADEEPPECQQIAPELDVVAKQLNATHARGSSVKWAPASVQQLPFSFQLDKGKPVEQATILTWDFFLPASKTYVNVMAPADNFAGRPQITIAWRNDSRVAVYGSSRAFGNGLHAELESGWYTLSILTPYVQSSSKSWNDVLPDVPGCIRYNLILNFDTQDKCVDAVPLPDQLAYVATSQHHIIDEFYIPEAGAHKLVLDTAGMKGPSLLHFLAWDPAQRVTVVLLELSQDGTGREINIGRDRLNQDLSVELLDILDQGKKYAISFTFAPEDSEVTPNAEPVDAATSSSAGGTGSSSSGGVAVDDDRAPQDAGPEAARFKTASTTDAAAAATTPRSRRRSRSGSECLTFSMQLALVPLNATPPAVPTGRGCHPLIGHLNLSEYGSAILPFDMQMDIVVSQKPTEPLMQVTLDLAEDVYVRGSLHYDFTVVSLQALICPGTSIPASYVSTDLSNYGCIISDPFFNGAELPATPLPAGKYTIVLVSWDQSVLTSGNADLLSFCRALSMHLMILPIKQPAVTPLLAAVGSGAAAVGTGSAGGHLCPATSQHMPHSLSMVGRLSALYGNRAHMQQHVRLNANNFQDVSLMELTTSSIVHFYIPAPQHVQTGLLIASQSGALVHQVAAGEAVMLHLPAGSYIISLQFAPPADSVYKTVAEALAVLGVCESVPLEMAITPVDQFRDAFTGAKSLPPGAQNGAASPFPTTMSHHGHQIMYRPFRGTQSGNFQKPYNESLSFTVGPDGGIVDVDVYYPFDVAPLAVQLLADATFTDDGTKVPSRLIAVSYKRNQAFQNVKLIAGSYTLRIVDPVSEDSYKRISAGLRADQIPAVVPYVLHLGYQPIAGAPPGSPLINNHSSSSPDVVTCPTRTDPWKPSLQRSVDSRVGPRADPDGWFTYHGKAFRIPFERATEGFPPAALIFGTSGGSRGGGAGGGPRDGAQPGGGRRQLFTVTRSMAFAARAGDHIRVWVRTLAKAIVSMGVFDASQPNSTVPLAVGSFWGWHTRSIGFIAPLSGTVSPGGMYRLDIVFSTQSLPVEGVDYGSACQEKLVATTFELFVSAFAASRLHGLQQCDDGASSSSDSNQATGAAPSIPAQLTLSVPQDVVGVSRFRESELNTRTIHNSDVSDGGPPGRGGPRPPGNEPRPPGQPGRHGPMANFFSTTVNAERNVTVTIPDGTKGARLLASVRFNLLLANMRLRVINAANDSSIAHSDCWPTSDRDERFNAMASLEMLNVPPGRYIVSLLEGSAEAGGMDAIAVGDTVREAAVCIPFEVAVHLSAVVYANGATDAPQGALRLINLQPGSIRNLDASDPLFFTLTFDRAVPRRHLLPGKAIVTLDDGGGRSYTPSAQYFETATTVRVRFDPYTLDWYSRYVVAVHLSALDLPSNMPAVSISGVAGGNTSVATASCGCDEGFCALGGMCPCPEPSGSTCQYCGDGALLSAKPLSVLDVTGRTCDPVDGSTATTTPPAWKPSPSGTSIPNSPANAGSTGRPGGPSSTAALPTASQRPPLRFLRVFLSYGAMVFLGGWALFTMVRHRDRIAREARQFHNPFRPIATSESDATAAAHHEDNDEEDGEDDNHAAPRVVQ